MTEFGKYLKSIREDHNISLETVAAKTSVRKQYLILIEEDRLEELPPIYGKSFIKSYCNYLEIPVEEYTPILERLDNQDKTINKVKSTNNTNQFNIKTNPNLEIFIKNLGLEKYLISNNQINILKISNNTKLINFFVVFLLLFLLIIFLFLDSNDGNQFQTDENSNLSPDTLVLETKEKGLLSYFRNSDSLVLEAYAIDTCWIKLNIDGKINKEIITTPSMNMRWSANEYFIITQGNVGAVQFKRNGKLLEPFGARGSVVKNIKITKDEVK